MFLYINDLIRLVSQDLNFQCFKQISTSVSKALVDITQSEPTHPEATFARAKLISLEIRSRDAWTLMSAPRWRGLAEIMPSARTHRLATTASVPKATERSPMRKLRANRLTSTFSAIAISTAPTMRNVSKVNASVKKDSTRPARCAWISTSAAVTHTFVAIVRLA